MTDEIKLEVGGKYRTRNGEKVEILAYKPSQDYPFIGIRYNETNGCWLAETWTEEGSYFVVAASSDRDGEDIVSKEPTALVPDTEYRGLRFRFEESETRHAQGLCQLVVPAAGYFGFGVNHPVRRVGWIKLEPDCTSEVGVVFAFSTTDRIIPEEPA